ncbi:MAG: hypothetical protein ACI8TX_001961 [Hyphomicrobiaceae bacterium]|jgi:uncharacterized protein (TIGR02453 family)
MSESFQGLPPDFMKFFRELAKNNEREWFQANKPRFEQSVKAPLLAFIEAMDVPLAKISDCFVADARGQGGSMFRIYRDVRFAKDKRPYKEHAACHFRHMAGKDAHAPGFYVHFEPGDVFFGGGIWRPPNPVLRQIRQAIVDDSDHWRAITTAPTFRKRFGQISGDQLVRAPQGFDPDHPCIEDLRRKGFFAVQRVDPKIVTSKDLVRNVIATLKALSPVMEFLTTAVGHSYSLDE